MSRRVGRRADVTGDVAWLVATQDLLLRQAIHEGETCYERTLPETADLDGLVLDDGTDNFPPSNLEFTSISTPTNTSNVIPGSATAKLNIRFNNLHRGEDLVAMVEDIVKREAPGATVRARISGEAFLTPPGQLYDLVVEARYETGIEPELSTSGGTSDGRVLIQLCPVVDFGLPNASMHKVGEHAAVDDIHSLSRIYERIVRGLVA